MDTELTVTKEKKKSLPSKMEFDASPASLIALAVDKDLDIEKLQKLIDMKNANDAKAAKMEFLNALSKFQGTLPPLVKNKTANIKYTDKNNNPREMSYTFHALPDIERHIRPYLNECGLSYRWGQKEENANISVWFILAHIGGHEEIGEPISGGLDNSGAKNLIQQKASTITYLRRYTLTGGLGISSGDADDDGSKGPKNAPVGLPYIKDAQLGSVIKSISEGKYTFDAEKLTLMAVDKEIAKATEKQAASLKKAQEEFNAKPKQ